MTNIQLRKRRVHRIYLRQWTSFTYNTGILKPAYNGTKKDRILPLQAGSLSQRYLKFGSTGLQILEAIRFLLKTVFRLIQVSLYYTRK